MIDGPAWFAAAVPVSTNIPVPMMAPIPSSVRSRALNVRLRCFFPCSTSPTSCSIDFVFSRCESIHPPEAARPAPHVMRPAGSMETELYIGGDLAEACEELAGAGLRVAGGEQISDHGDARRAGGQYLRCALERDAADGNNGHRRVSGGSGELHEIESDGVVARVLRPAPEHRPHRQVGDRLCPCGGYLLTRVRGEAHDRGRPQESPCSRRRQVVLP